MSLMQRLVIHSRWNVHFVVNSEQCQWHGQQQRVRGMKTCFSTYTLSPSSNISTVKRTLKGSISLRCLQSNDSAFSDLDKGAWMGRLQVNTARHFKQTHLFVRGMFRPFPYAPCTQTASKCLLSCGSPFV